MALRDNANFIEEQYHNVAGIKSMYLLIKMIDRENTFLDHKIQFQIFNFVSF